jgi:hypothetical protein
MKVLHLPANVAGNAFGLAQGERLLGLDSKALSIGESQYYFPSDIIIPAKKKLMQQLYYRAKTFLKIRNQYDVYHFNFGSSLLHYLNYGLNLAELPFYNSQALKVVTYQGCDARQKYPTIKRLEQRGKGHAACSYEGCYQGICNSGRRDTMRQKAIDKMMQHCSHAFALNPDLLYFLPKDKATFLPYTIPNFEAIEPKTQVFFANNKIKIVHAPTQRVTKGSHFILQAIEILQEKYPNKIDFQLVENVPYEQALQIYRSADLVIDQLLIGWYGGLAVEVMKMGIPVMAYINEDDLYFIPKSFARDLPIINTDPDTLLHCLSKIVNEREQLIEIGARSQQFVDQWHHPKYVAGITKQVYERCAVS